MVGVAVGTTVGANVVIANVGKEVGTPDGNGVNGDMVGWLVE